MASKFTQEEILAFPSKQVGTRSHDLTGKPFGKLVALESVYVGTKCRASKGISSAVLESTTAELLRIIGVYNVAA